MEKRRGTREPDENAKGDEDSRKTIGASTDSEGRNRDRVHGPGTEGEKGTRVRWEKTKEENERKRVKRGRDDPED